MRVLVFIALIQTYACDPPSRRSVNLALETVVEFNKNDNSADIQIIDKVRSFLDRVKHVIDNKNVYGDSRRSLQSGTLKFSDFVKQALVILISYKDSDLEDVMSAVDHEIRKYHYKGCRFHELVENTSVRRFMANNLEKMKNAEAKDVKSHLRKMLNTFENNNIGLMQKVVMNYVDSLYGDKSETKFKDLLNKLETYKSKTKRSNLNLVKVVRDGIRSVVFDHYSGLDYKTRRDLKLKLETFWQNFRRPDKNLHHIWNFQTQDRTDKKIGRSNENFRHSDDVGSSSLEIHPSTERSRYLPRQDVPKRQRDKHTTRRRLTFITLYPEEMTILEKRKHKKKSTKSIKASTYLRHEKLKSKSKSKKKHQAFRKIVSEHEAVIKVDRETIDRAFPAYEDLLNYKTRQTHRHLKRAKMIPKTFKRRSSTHKKQEKSSRRRHEKKSRKVMDIPAPESEEGLSISFEGINLARKSLRKSNTNDTLLLNNTGTNETTDDPTLSITTSDSNVIKRINDLEKELRVVQAQIKVTNAEHIDFWEGTPEPGRDTTPKLTTETTTTEMTTTTSEPETTTTTVATTEILTTKINGTMFGPVFRTQYTNESDAVEKGPVNQENKSLENKIAVTKDDAERNVSRVIPVSQDNVDDPLKLNNSAEFDYLNDVKGPEINITGIDDIERYLNESKPIGDGKNHQIVRTQMLQQLKGIFSENPETDSRNKAFYSSTPSPSTDQDVTTDPLNFLDIGADDI